MKGAAIAWAVDYGRITPLLAKAIQDIAAIGATFKANLIAWFADAANGIGDFFARRGIFEEVCVKDANGRTCLNRSQVDALLSGSAAAGASVLGGSESHGGSSADEIPTADESTVPHNSDDSATTATSTLDAVSATDNEPVADAPVDEGPDTQSVEDTPAEETTEPAPDLEPSNDKRTG